MSNEPQVNMNAVVSDTLSTPPPCQAVVGVDEYRRVCWELYNTDKDTDVYPIVFGSLATQSTNPSDGWITEVIKKTKRVYDKYPFDTLPAGYIPITTPPPAPVPVDPTSPTTPVSQTVSQKCITAGGYWCDKIQYCFDSEADMLDYITSIGSTYYDDSITGGWYGADLSASDLYVNPEVEIPMYTVENSGGLYGLLEDDNYVDYKIYSDERLMQYDEFYTTDSNGNPEAIQLNGLFAVDVIGGRGVDRVDKGKSFTVMHDPISGECYVMSIVLSDPPAGYDTPPPVPAPTPDAIVVPVISATTRMGTVCMDIPFPYAQLPSAIIQGLGQNMLTTYDVDSINIPLFSSIPFPGLGIPEFYNSIFGQTINYNTGDAMVEAKQIGVSIPTALRSFNINAIKAIFEPVLNLVGGSWDILSSLVPSVSIDSVDVNPIDMTFNSDNAVQDLMDKFLQAIASGESTYDSIITAIYNAIGSDYDYSNEQQKIPNRDLLDATNTLYDWSVMKVEMGFVGVCNYFGKLAQIFTIPPTPPPNPKWISTKVVNGMFDSIYDGTLAKIMDGSFPGFTAMDIYSSMMENINELVTATMDKTRTLQQQLDAVNKEIADTRVEMQKEVTKINLGDGSQDKYDQLSIHLSELLIRKSELEAEIAENNRKVSDRWALLLSFSNDLPLIKSANIVLGLMGMSVDDLIDLHDNGYNQSLTATSDFSSDVKMWCQSILNQVSTFPVTFVTDWVGRITSIFGVSFPDVSINICVPLQPATTFEQPKIVKVPTTIPL